ncbi:Ribonuclease H-like protein [Rhizoctonia solani]|uniref:Ribonuclease H-like protein n=1 Tax=Rhizoctonia solani TaxID=456999 RepID=A0A8H7I9F1_9AGAM|nr:Ribonuclease H-like protein [Rhizoctonia solani]
MKSQNHGLSTSFGSSASPTDPRHESPSDPELEPRKRSRKSTIMDALRRGISQTDAVSVPSRQMSTSSLPRFPNRSRSSTSTGRSPASPTGLPFYRHNEALDSISLPAVPTTNIKYLRDLDLANAAVAQMMDRMEPFPGSRWRGVVGFDMEWTVGLGMAQRKTGLIQLSDTRTILLIQISAMDSFPHMLKGLICSGTILKVGVNVVLDMKKLCRDFGSSYAARGVLDLSDLARTVDVGLVGTKIDDLDSNRASMGVGVFRADEITERDDPTKSDSENDISGEEGTPAPGANGTRATRRDLEKGDVRTSDWERVLTAQQRLFRYSSRCCKRRSCRTSAILRSSMLHSRSVANGSIPVPSPAPWENQTSSEEIKDSPSGRQPTPPPPFRSKATNSKTLIERKFIPPSELQNLTALQLESILPWDSLVKDLHAEFENARAAVLVKREKEGVDLKGRGEAVVTVETIEPSEQAHATLEAHVPDLQSATAGSSSIFNPLGDTHYDNLQSGNTRTLASEDKRRSIRQRHAFQDKENEALGKKWPPSRNFTLYPAGSRSLASSSTTSSIPRSVSVIKTPLSSDEMDPQLQEPTRLVVNTRYAGSSSLNDDTRSVLQQPRAYILWHKQRLSLSQICASMRSGGNPLTKSTVISYIIETLKANDKLPFEASRLKDLIALDKTGWVRENYRQFLEAKVGPL